jgi:enoyl-CoA hydratase
MTESSDRSLVLTKRDGAILTITLNRPEKSNSLHPDLVNELSRILAETEASADLSVLVITGAGRHFSAGLDLGLLLAWSAEEKIAYLESVIRVFQRIWALPQPVIAAVNGAAIAGGFDLAAFCDIRLAATGAVFGQAEINLGLVQIIHPLYKSIGLARAKELAMTGANITAEEAYRIGLVNHVYPAAELMPRAMEMARAIASRPRNALFETKRLTRELVDLDTKDALDEVVATLRRCLASKEHEGRVAEVHARITRS